MRRTVAFAIVLSMFVISAGAVHAQGRTLQPSTATEQTPSGDLVVSVPLFFLNEVARLHRLAAEQGDASAQFQLGRMYYEGWGVVQDYAEAVRWYRLAADQGLAAAQYNLGLSYGAGRGIPRDVVSAHLWWNLAAANAGPWCDEPPVPIICETTSLVRLVSGWGGFDG